MARVNIATSLLILGESTWLSLTKYHVSCGCLVDTLDQPWSGGGSSLLFLLCWEAGIVERWGRGEDLIILVGKGANGLEPQVLYVLCPCYPPAPNTVPAPRRGSVNICGARFLPTLPFVFLSSVLCEADARSPTLTLSRCHLILGMPLFPIPHIVSSLGLFFSAPMVLCTWNIVHCI